MEIRHADLQIEVEDAEDGGVLLTIIDSARLSLSLPWPSCARKSAGAARSALMNASPSRLGCPNRLRSSGFRFGV